MLFRTHSVARHVCTASSSFRPPIVNTIRYTSSEALRSRPLDSSNSTTRPSIEIDSDNARVELSNAHPSPAQISRLGSATIRAFLAEGDHKSAFSVLNEIYAYHHPHRLTTSSSGKNASPFVSHVSLNLVTTTLIHGLIRANMPIKAANVVAGALAGKPVNTFEECELAIQAHTRLKLRTVKALIQTLCPPVLQQDVLPISQQTAATQYWGTALSKLRAKRTGKPLNLFSRAAVGLRFGSQNPRLLPETRTAVGLMRLLRNHQHQRTNDLYGWIIDACLLQGEIITACLLFVLLVKDYQVRKAFQKAMKAREDARAASALMDGSSSASPFSPTTVEPNGSSGPRPWPRDMGGYSLHLSNGVDFGSLSESIGDPPWDPGDTILGMPLSKALEVGLHRSQYDLPLPYPSAYLLQKIIRHIDFDSPPADELVDPDASPLTPLSVSVEDSLLTLECLTHLMQQRLIPPTHAAGVIKKMYSVPRFPEHIVGQAKIPFLTVSEQPHDVPCSSDPRTYTSLGLDPDQPISLHAFSHAVLKSLITDLPMLTSPVEVHSSLLTSLDVKGTNTLLHYALRHCFSLKLAQKVIDYKSTFSDNSHFDADCWNVLMRAGTLMRIDGLYEDALGRLSGNNVAPPELDGTVISTLPKSSSIPLYTSTEHVLKLPHPSTSAALRPTSFTLTAVLAHKASSNANTGDAKALLQALHPSLDRSRVREDLVPRGAAPQIGPVGATIGGLDMDLSGSGPWVWTALLNYLVKAGRLRDARMVFKWAERAASVSQIPPSIAIEDEASMLDQPTTIPIESEAPVSSSSPRDLAPHLSVPSLPSSLDSPAPPLPPSSETSPLSLRLTSVFPQPEWNPWCLPVEAYTVMLQGHARELKQAIRAVRRDPSSAALYLSGRYNSRASGGRGKGKKWARLRHEVARESAIQSLWERKWRGSVQVVYEAMVGAHTRLLDARVRMLGYSPLSSLSGEEEEEESDEERKRMRALLKMKLPVPDVRFYNALLSVSTHSLGQTSRSNSGQRSPSSWRWQIERALAASSSSLNRAASRRGTVMQADDALASMRDLKGIVEEMRSFGMDVPVGALRLLAGSADGLESMNVVRGALGSGVTSVGRDARLLNGVPVGFEASPKRLSFDPWKGLTVKTRGLPIRRRSGGAERRNVRVENLLRRMEVHVQPTA